MSVTTDAQRKIEQAWDKAGGMGRVAYANLLERHTMFSGLVDTGVFYTKMVLIPRWKRELRQNIERSGFFLRTTILPHRHVMIEPDDRLTELVEIVWPCE